MKFKITKRERIGDIIRLKLGLNHYDYVISRIDSEKVYGKQYGRKIAGEVYIIDVEDIFLQSKNNIEYIKKEDYIPNQTKNKI
jgi:hypothetical protein